jgi:hypothetical protein
MRAQNTTVQYESVFESRKLAGIVYAGFKAPGNQLSDATVELCRAEWEATRRVRLIRFNCLELGIEFELRRL